jgi:hypothetical protein
MVRFQYWYLMLDIENTSKLINLSSNIYIRTETNFLRQQTEQQQQR